MSDAAPAPAAGDRKGMEAVAARHRLILAQARQAGRVDVEDLAARLAVTPQTIRKDLNILARKSLLARVHGGAIVTSGVDNLAYGERRLVAAGAKAAIGRAAAALIPDGASLFITIGTTTEAVAEALDEHRDLLVISNNLNVIDRMSGRADRQVIAVGGRVRAADRAIIGPLAAEFLRNFKVDFAVIGASAIDAEGALLDFDTDEVQVARTIIAQARQVILVADHSKVGRPAPVRIGGFEEIGHFVTDRLDDPRLAAACAAAGTRVTCCADPT
ncbi:DeoR/GlpR family DNA-binding transcription regulator [Sphingomonas morindae]|uniref:DeoR/GlpR family DNA-binding transcription regulator n=1 Tax=Sphingomonas morindae TaxID=1541170 RepID=A0ABY4X9U0_9SPHN|nr:DeoR/GlpR family DNA-binding transcription regulator [Sphingomonas morindae]USI73702.1 DeoR/GlpR family DNA-binding transcription regulator [Sphingomonas morindae]